MLGCFNPNLGQIWTNPNVGLKMSFKMLTKLHGTFLTPNLGLSIFYPAFEKTQNFLGYKLNHHLTNY